MSVITTHYLIVEDKITLKTQVWQSRGMISVPVIAVSTTHVEKFAALHLCRCH
jgi:hypothetical protein